MNDGMKDVHILWTMRKYERWNEKDMNKDIGWA